MLSVPTVAQMAVLEEICFALEQEQKQRHSQPWWQRE